MEKISLCKYKDIFGKPATGVHSYRVFNVAIADVIGTILIAYIFSLLTKVNFLWSLLIFFILGELMHFIFCVDTTFTKNISKYLKSIR